MSSSGTPGAEPPPPMPPDLEKLREFFTDIQAGAFSESKAYNSVIMGIGYAGAFGLWNIVKSNLSAATSNWIVVLFGISLTTFIGWTIFGMLWMVAARWRWQTQLQGLVGQAVIDRYAALEKEEKRKQWVMMWPWVVVVITCTVTAALGLVILLVACAGQLLQVT